MATTLSAPLSATSGVRSARAWYVSRLLFLVGAFNLMDRQILSILLEPIKHRILRGCDARAGDERHAMRRHAPHACARLSARDGDLHFIGTGFGPLTVGLVSDMLATRLGTSALQAALWIAAVTSLGAALAFAAGARHLRADGARASRPL